MFSSPIPEWDLPTLSLTTATPLELGFRTEQSLCGNDLTSFANNKKNRIEHIVIGSQGTGFPKGEFSSRE
jgi:hypothetical protein